MSSPFFRNSRNTHQDVDIVSPEKIERVKNEVISIMAPRDNVKNVNQRSALDQALNRFPKNEWRNIRRKKRQSAFIIGSLPIMNNYIGKTSKHYSQLIKNITVDQNMEELLNDIRKSKIRGMKARAKLIKNIRKVMLQCAVAKMKKRLDEYERDQQRRQQILAAQSHDRAQSEFYQFWTSSHVIGTLFGDFGDNTKHEILNKWLNNGYHKKSNIWNLFNKENEIHKLFDVMEFDIKLYSFGSTIFEKDAKGGYFYTILDGQVSIWIPSKGTSGKWEKLKVLEAPQCFGELALFPNGTGKRNATCLSMGQCLMLLVSKENYLKYIHEKIMKKQKKNAKMYQHLKRSSSKENLERLAIIATIAMEQIFEPLTVIIPDKIHEFNDDIQFDKNSIYVIKSGVVSLCVSSEKQRDMTLKKGKANTRSSQSSFLELGAGSIIDCRTMYLMGIKRYNHRNIYKYEQSVVKRIYYIAKTNVVVEKFKLNSFIEVGGFNLHSLYQVAKMELFIVIQNYKKTNGVNIIHQQWDKVFNIKEDKVIDLKKHRYTNPAILNTNIWYKSPLELYEINEQKQLQSDEKSDDTNSCEIIEFDETPSKTETPSDVDSNYHYDPITAIPICSAPLPDPLKVIKVSYKDLPSIFK